MNGVRSIKVRYRKLWIILIEKDIFRMIFRQVTELSSGMMNKLNKGEEVALSVLLRIFNYLHCNIGDTCEAVRVDKEICFGGS